MKKMQSLVDKSCQIHGLLYDIRLQALGLSLYHLAKVMPFLDDCACILFCL